MNDDATLRENKVTNGSKIMVVGSTINDVLAVTEPALKTHKQNDKFDTVSSKEPFCKQKVGYTSQRISLLLSTVNLLYGLCFISAREQ